MWQADISFIMMKPFLVKRIIHILKIHVFVSTIVNISMNTIITCVYSQIL